MYSQFMMHGQKNIKLDDTCLVLLGYDQLKLNLLQLVGLTKQFKCQNEKLEPELLRSEVRAYLCRD